MGASMAKNLLKNFDSVEVFDLSTDSVNALVAAGAKRAESVKSLAANSNVIVTMVPATPHVIGLMRGPNGIFANAAKGTLLIDSSTIDPITSKELIAEAKNLGLSMLDAPVSGGVTGAAAGTLTFMVGGEVADVERASGVLQHMGKKVAHCGGAGSGGVAKLCNNLSLAIQMIGTSEALALGVRLGMDPKVLSGVLNTSTGRCWSSEVYNPVPGVVEGVPSGRGYTGGFGTALMEKDLVLANDAARSVKARLPLGAAAMQLYGLMSEHGYGQKDFSSVFEFITKSHGK